MKKIILIALFLIKSSLVYATPPATCSIGSGYYDITTSTVTLYICTNTNTWTSVSANSLLPSGSIIGTLSSCPTGFTELTSLNGKMLRGTIVANGNVGTTGGSDTITPTIVSLSAAPQIFTGSALSTHTHTLTATGTNSATATSGNCAATNVAIGTGATNACKATAPNLTVPAETFTGSSATSSAVSGGTPSGTNGSSTVTGTLNSFDNRSAYINVIFCSKN